MSYVEPTGQSIRDLGDSLAIISAWIDDAPVNAVRDPEARTWGRIAKVGEEFGEVVAAFIGATGQNPRKGQTHGLMEVGLELLDVALTALAAYEHLHGNQGKSGAALVAHVDRVKRRAGHQ